MLGDEQWSWLEQQLAIPGFGLRVIASSITVHPTYTGLEAWTFFPEERKRILDLIVQSKNDGVIFISGDVHYAEFSSFTLPQSEEEGMYTLYEATSSGLTMAESVLEIMPNSNRIEGTKPVGGLGGNNWGVLEVDFSEASSTTSASANPQIKLSIMNDEGEAVESVAVQFNEISWR